MFGGTFDPFHRGHLAIAKAALAQGLGPVVVVPTAQPPHRHAPFATAADRLAMCGAAVAGMEGVEVSDAEVRRGGVSYTVDTLEMLTAARPAERWALVVGGDAPPALAGWRESERIMEMADVWVAPRFGTPEPTPPMRPLPMEPVLISSRRIREGIAERRDVSEWVSEGVLEIIAERGLYGA